MKLTPVTSKHIEAIGWEEGRLRVRFKGNGKVYDYPDVTEGEYDALRQAKSIGTAFARDFRGREGWTKVEEESESES